MLNVRVLVYVKDQANNISIMTFAFTLIVSCEILGMLVPFVKIYWGKCWQCAMDEIKVCASLTSISIKLAQSILQKTITWTKKMVRDDMNHIRHA